VETATLRDSEVSTCPSNCNGRGKCSSEGLCDCMAGYSGEACDTACPNECSHQGDCVEGACLCFNGFSGADCSTETCCHGHGSCEDPDTCVCDPGWGGDECGEKLICEDPDCSGHGTCKNGVCVCKPGFLGANCSVPEGGCDPACGENGMCNPETKACVCAAGYTGVTCAVQVQTCPNYCSNKGLCLNGKCMCGAGWAGDDCSQPYFAPGEDTTALAPAEGAIGVSASGELSGEGDALDSVASPSNSSSASLLNLQSTHNPPNSQQKDLHLVKMMASQKSRGGPVDEYLGWALEGTGITSATATANDQSAVEVCGSGGTCSGNGVCNTTFGKCECNGLWKGYDCSTLGCPGLLETGKDCSGNGVCEDGVCLCAPGWGLDPAKNATNATNMCADSICPVPCGDHGFCDHGMCRCQQGWSGPNCRDPQCPGDCSGHGICSQPSPNWPGECTCDNGYGGSACERVAMYESLQSCPLDCSGNGLCLNGLCACNVGFTGPACSDVSCPEGFSGPDCDLRTCPNDCSGKGLCMQQECVCFSGFTGADCSLPDQCFEPCHGVCSGEASSNQEQCNFCVGTCLTALTNPPLGSHSPFEDLQSTLLQVASPENQQQQQQKQHQQQQHQSLGKQQQHHHRRHQEVSSVRVTPAVAR